MRRLLFFDFYPLLAKGEAIVVGERIDGVELIEANTFAEVERILGELQPIDLAIVGVGGENDFRVIELIDSKGISMILFYHDPAKIFYLKSTFTHVVGLASMSLDTDAFANFMKQVLEKGKGICPITQQYFFDHLYLADGAVVKESEKPAVKSTGLESLTKREKELFLMLKEGMNQRAISKKMAIKPSTVSTLKKKVYAKLGVENVIQLVKKY